MSNKRLPPGKRKYLQRKPENPNGRPLGETTEARVEAANEIANKLSSAALALENSEEYSDLFRNLSPKQKVITRLRLRGLAVSEIAKSMGITTQAISQELKIIRDFFAAQGKTIDQDVLVGETMSLFNEVEIKAWDLFNDSNDESIKLKALHTVMTAREKHTKLLMDVGKIEKVAAKVEHSMDENSFIKKFQNNPKAMESFAATLIEAQLEPLEAPAPPVLDHEISDAEIITGENEDE